MVVCDLEKHHHIKQEYLGKVSLLYHQYLK